LFFFFFSNFFLDGEREKPKITATKADGAEVENVSEGRILSRLRVDRAISVGVVGNQQHRREAAARE
jgi:hypothetical protein